MKRFNRDILYNSMSVVRCICIIRYKFIPRIKVCLAFPIRVCHRHECRSYTGTGRQTDKIESEAVYLDGLQVPNISGCKSWAAPYKVHVRTWRVSSALHINRTLLASCSLVIAFALIPNKKMILSYIIKKESRIFI